MRVLLDGGSSGSGGYVHHLRGVLTARAPADLELTLLCSAGLVDRLGPLAPHVRVIAEPTLDDSRLAARRAWWRDEFPAVVRATGPDVLLHAHGLVRGDAGRVPRAVIHHNIAPFTAETYRLYGPTPAGLRILATRARLVRGMRRSAGVVFVDEHPRDVVTRQVRGIRRHAVTGNATPAEYLNLPVAAAATLPTQVRVLCVSTQHLSKYLWNVVHAVMDVRAATRLDLRLDLVGGGDPRTGKRIRAAVRDRAAARFVTVHEDVPAALMPDWYAGADVFVFPSTQETFPITLLEAMATGLPIACSDQMAMPRMLRDAGLYFDPRDPDQLAVALRTLLADGDLRVRLGRQAQRYAREHTWQRSADRLFAFLATLADPAAGQAAGPAAGAAPRTLPSRQRTAQPRTAAEPTDPTALHPVAVHPTALHPVALHPTALPIAIVGGEVS